MVSGFFSVGLNATGISRGSRALTRLRKRTRDMRPIFRKVRPVVQNIFLQRFRLQGPGWKPHSPATTKIHGPHRILALTGKLRRSLTKTGARGSFSQITRTRFTHGTRLRYAAAVNNGFTQPVTASMRGFFRGHGIGITKDKIKVPARPFLFLTRKDERRIRDVGEAALRSQVSAAETG